MSEGFRHVDGQQTIVFGSDALDRAADRIGEGYMLLTTARAAQAAPAVANRSLRLIEVPAGPVDELAAQLLEAVGTAPVVALGGGRVIDTAKAIATAKCLAGPAIPTSLSGAEMSLSPRWRSSATVLCCGLSGTKAWRCSWVGRRRRALRRRGR